MEQNTDFASVLARRRMRQDGAEGSAPPVGSTSGLGSSSGQSSILSRDGMTRALYLVTAMISLVAVFTMWSQ